MRRLRPESGAVAIYLSVIIGILLVTTTVYATRVSVSELNQSSQIDLSEQAYYAAEAGVEEAVNRIDNVLQAMPTATICQIFPQQFNLAVGPNGACPASQPGDAHDLSLDPTNPMTTPTSTAAASGGDLSWQGRRVFQESAFISGTQVKDQTEQFDLSDLCRRLSNGNIYGTAACNPNVTDIGDDYDCGVGAFPACNGSTIFTNHFQGLQFCYISHIASGDPGPEFEVTDINFASSLAGSFTTEKVLWTAGSGTATLPSGSQVTARSAGTLANQYCFSFVPGSAASRRYIVRIKLVTPPGFALGGNQDYYQVSYQATLLETPKPPSNEGLYLPNNAYIIDVIGQAGDVRRRIIAKKVIGNKILGLFDYVLYSGDPSYVLCKAGVQQSDVAYNTQSCLTPPGSVQ